MWKILEERKKIHLAVEKLVVKNACFSALYDGWGKHHQSSFYSLSCSTWVHWTGLTSLKQLQELTGQIH